MRMAGVLVKALVLSYRSWPVDAFAELGIRSPAVLPIEGLVYSSLLTDIISQSTGQGHRTRKS